MNRRIFMMQSGLACVGSALQFNGLAMEKPNRLTILHTNDVHSRLDPFPLDGSINSGKGGIAARAALIKKIRAEEEHVLLLDAGDIFQGTPYFNVFKGEPEMKAMNMMGYDAAIMGNHDFDAGMEVFAHQLKTQGRFDILMCNYGFAHTPMEYLFKPYKIFRKGELRIGVTGVGIELEGLVPEVLFGKTVYQDPVESANRIASQLKKEGCDLIICISHLGDRYSDSKISDEVFAKSSEHIDLIIGGHTHRFFDKPREYTNNLGKKVIVNQVGWGGLQLGRLDFSFLGGGAKNLDKNQSICVV